VASKFFFTPFVTIPVAPDVTSIIKHFMFHIPVICCFLLRDIPVRRYWHIYHDACFLCLCFCHFHKTAKSDH
jgi:hypothetical protein